MTMTIRSYRLQSMAKQGCNTINSTTWQYYTTISNFTWQSTAIHGHTWQDIARHHNIHTYTCIHTHTHTYIRLLDVTKGPFGYTWLYMAIHRVRTLFKKQISRTFPGLFQNSDWFFKGSKIHINPYTPKISMLILLTAFHTLPYIFLVE